MLSLIKRMLNIGDRAYIPKDSVNIESTALGGSPMIAQARN